MRSSRLLYAKTARPPRSALHKQFYLLLASARRLHPPPIPKIPARALKSSRRFRGPIASKTDKHARRPHLAPADEHHLVRGAAV